MRVIIFLLGLAVIFVGWFLTGGATLRQPVTTQMICEYDDSGRSQCYKPGLQWV